MCAVRVHPRKRRRASTLVDAYRLRVDWRASVGAATSMLVAQLGHITEMSATDWLQPTRAPPTAGR